MKKIIAFFIVFFITISCSLNDEPSRDFVLLPVETVELPSSYSVNTISPIKLRYKRPSTCHIFDGIYYNAVNNDRIVAIKCVKLNENNCLDTSNENPYETTLNFLPKESGVYHFMFWQGTNENNQDIYLEFDITVN